MVNFKTEMSIYDKFIDKKELTTKRIIRVRIK